LEFTSTRKEADYGNQFERPVTSRHEITISAPLESVWIAHTEIGSWPRWNPDIAKAELTGPIVHSPGKSRTSGQR